VCAGRRPLHRHRRLVSAHGADATSVGVSGCTWGQQAILTGMIAAPGMCVEFDNGVRTTRVREVQLIRHGGTSVH
jgi:hypothetical protein